MADFGLYHITARKIGRKDADENFIVRRVFALRLVISGTILLLIPIIVWLLPYENDTRIAIILMAIAFFFSSSYGLFNSVFQKYLAMDRVAITEFFGKLVQILWFAGVIYYDGGFLWIVAGVIIAMIFNALILLKLVKKYVNPLPIIDKFYWKKFIRQSAPMGIAAIITFLYFKVNIILLSWWVSPEEVGIYSAAYKVMENLIFFPAMIMGLMLPIFSRTIFTNKKLFASYVNKILKVFLLFIVPIVIGIWFTASDIMHLIGGEEYTDSVIVLKMLTIALFFIFFGQLFTTLLLVANLQKILMTILIIAAIINIIGNTIAIKLWSYMGAVGISIITELFVFIACAIIAYKHKNILYTPHIPQGWRIIAAGITMGIGLLFLSGLGFFFTIIISGVIYMITLIVLKAIKKNELREIFIKSS